MKNCTDCKHAQWKRTKAGSLHPSGDGKCTYQYKVPPLPASMYWITSPSPCGGYINRRKDLTEHCAFWSKT
jgi:hypothetical protein